MLALPAAVRTVHPSASAVRYSDKHLVWAEFRGAVGAPWTNSRDPVTIHAGFVEVSFPRS